MFYRVRKVCARVLAATAGSLELASVLPTASLAILFKARAEGHDTNEPWRVHRDKKMLDLTSSELRGPVLVTVSYFIMYYVPRGDGRRGVLRSAVAAPHA